MSELSENSQKIADIVTAADVKHVYTSEELQQISHLLAKAVATVETKEGEKKQAMAALKAEIDLIKVEVKKHSININNGFCYIDIPCELWLDYDSETRVYLDKQTHDFVRSEKFHAADYQKKIDFKGTTPADDAQIAENNSIGEYADPDNEHEESWQQEQQRHLLDNLPEPDALDEIIENKKKGGKKQSKQ